MKNKQKSYRLRAAAAKQYAIDKGVHIKGQRYGKAIRNVESQHRALTKGIKLPHPLLVSLVVRAEVLRLEGSL